MIPRPMRKETELCTQSKACWSVSARFLFLKIMPECIDLFYLTVQITPEAVCLPLLCFMSCFQTGPVKTTGKAWNISRKEKSDGTRSKQYLALCVHANPAEIRCNRRSYLMTGCIRDVFSLCFFLACLL